MYLSLRRRPSPQERVYWAFGVLYSYPSAPPELSTFMHRCSPLHTFVRQWAVRPNFIGVRLYLGVAQEGMRSRFP